MTSVIPDYSLTIYWYSSIYSLIPLLFNYWLIYSIPLFIIIHCYSHYWLLTNDIQWLKWLILFNDYSNGQWPNIIQPNDQTWFSIVIPLFNDYSIVIEGYCVVFDWLFPVLFIQLFNCVAIVLIFNYSMIFNIQYSMIQMILFNSMMAIVMIFNSIIIQWPVCIQLFSIIHHCWLVCVLFHWYCCIQLFPLLTIPFHYSIVIQILFND